MRLENAQLKLNHLYLNCVFLTNRINLIYN